MREKRPTAELAEDLFIEVSHGPTLLDNNIFLSEYAVKLATQGVAMVHNIIAGSLVGVGRGVNNGALTRQSVRYTPYHVPHRTEVAGFMTILHGDCKFYNNIFIQQEPDPFFLAEMMRNEKNDWDDRNVVVGTVPYENYPTFEEWDKLFEGYCGMGSPASDRYYTELPVWAGGNVYLNGAVPMSKETDACVVTGKKAYIRYAEKDGKPGIDTNLYEFLPATKSRLLSTDDIAPAFEPEEKYENPDGSPIVFDTDFFGKKRGGSVLPGAFADGSADAGKPLLNW